MTNLTFSSSQPSPPQPMPSSPLPPSAFPGFALHHLRYLLPLGALFITALAQKVYTRLISQRRRKALILEGPRGLAQDWHQAREISDGMGLLLVGHAREVARLAKERDDLREQCEELQGEVDELRLALEDQGTHGPCPVCGHDASGLTPDLIMEDGMQEEEHHWVGDGSSYSEDGFLLEKEQEEEEEDVESLLAPRTPLVRASSAIDLSDQSGMTFSTASETMGSGDPRIMPSDQSSSSSSRVMMKIAHGDPIPFIGTDHPSFRDPSQGRASPPISSIPLTRSLSSPAALADAHSTSGLARDLQRISDALATAEDQATGVAMAIKLLRSSTSSSSSSSHSTNSRYRHSVASFSDLTRR